MRRSISFQSGQLGPSSGGRRPQSVSAAARPPALPGQLSPPSGGRRFSVTALSQFQPGPLNPSSGDRRPQTVTPSHASDTRVVPMERYNLLALDHMRLRSELEVKSKELAKLQDIFAQNAEYQKEIAVLQEKLRQEIKDHDAAKAQASSIEITCNTLNSRFRDLEARSRKVAELIKPMLIRFEEHSSEICSLRKTVSGLKANEKSISTKYELAKKHVVEAQKNLSAIEQEAAELCEQLNNPTSGHYATKKRHSAQCDDPFDNEVPLGAQLHHEEPKRELSVASKTSVEGERAITTGELRAKSTKVFQEPYQIV